MKRVHSLEFVTLSYYNFCNFRKYIVHLLMKDKIFAWCVINNQHLLCRFPVVIFVYVEAVMKNVTNVPFVVILEWTFLSCLLFLIPNQFFQHEDRCYVFCIAEILNFHIYNLIYILIFILNHFICIVNHNFVFL